MKSGKMIMVSMVLATMLFGCNAIGKKLQPAAPPAVPPTADIYVQKALAFERQSEYQQALFSWRIAARLDKTDPRAAEAIKRLESLISAKAREHYQKGRQQFEVGGYAQARKEFLIALRYEPGHLQAFHYLKKRLPNTGQSVYRVKAGDSYNRIASRIYKDPSKAYIIAHFNDLNLKKPLQIGTTLLLPDIKQAYLKPESVLKPKSGVGIMLGKARTAYQNQLYDQALSLIQTILDEAGEHPEASQLADAAHFDKGTALFQKKQYKAAVEHLQQVNPNYAGRDTAIAKARHQIRQAVVAEKLDQAQQDLRNNAWQKVLATTEEILSQDPDNPQAHMLFSNASYQLAKFKLNQGKLKQAADFLSRIDPSYEDTAQLLTLARARMKSQAETHYRDGVKHFINEDLERAIEVWEQTLELNSEHPKARNDIENAKRLLEKLKALEKHDPHDKKNP